MNTDMKKTYIKPSLEIYEFAQSYSICAVSGGSAAGSGVGEGEENMVKGHYMETEEESWQNDYNVW